jgi:rubrerythrin
LEAQIEERQRELDDLEAAALKASAETAAALSDDGSSAATLARAQKEQRAAQAQVDALQAEHERLIAATAAIEGEDALLAHFEARSCTDSRLEEAQIAFAVANEALYTAASSGAAAAAATAAASRAFAARSYPVAPTGSWDVDALQAELSVLRVQEVPTSDEDMVVYITRVSDLENQLEAAQVALAEARSQSGAAAKSGGGSAVAKAQALEEEYNRLVMLDSTSMSAAETEARMIRLSLVQSEYEVAQLAALEELTSGGNGGSGGSCDGGDEAFMVHWGQRDAAWVLPLDLPYPTPAMSRRVDALRLNLGEARVAARRVADARVDEERRQLTAQLEGLEDQVRSARARTAQAQDVAAAEARAASDRQTRRAAEEAKRARREAARRAEERKAAAARERHEADDRATQAAFSRVGGDGGAAAFGGRGDFRMCGRCKTGPIENFACSDLAAHNDTSTSYKGNTVAATSRPNDCPNCGWFDENWHNWPMWDGIHGPH